MKYKRYSHFDKVITIKEANEYVKNIHNHQYLPFITYKKDKNKWDKNHKKINEFRTISIASIKDNYVYQYYNEYLSKEYEKYIKNTDLNECVCAYRKNNHKCNVDFFVETYEYIKKCKKAKIFVGDISHFFDTLDHKILKDNLKEVLNVSELDENLYKMLKSLEKASYIELDDIIKFLNEKGIYIYTGKDKYKDICNYCNKKNIPTIVKKEWFRELKTNYMKPTKEELKNKKIGIVQGSSASGVLSNIYMISVDKEIIQLLSKYDYFYRRYCDDFIIVIKNINDLTYNKIIDDVSNIITKYKLELKESKIQKFDYNNGIITGTKKFIQFLGFELHGNSEVYIRQSTQDRWIHKILQTKKIFKKYTNIYPRELLMEVIRIRNYKKLKNILSKNYKERTLGTYISKSINKIDSDKIKLTKKNLVNLIDKHIK